MALPLWKVKRELKRLVFQLQDLPRRLRQLPGQLRHDKTLAEYDANFDQATRLIPGAALPGPKVALLVIYQPRGLPASIFHTIEYLTRHGYAVLAVLNTPLPEGDLARLTALCWQVLERPNFGYDFGGYRDGLRILNRQGVTPDRLIIMNDSVWFPFQGDPLAQMEAALEAEGLDGLGLNQDQKLRRDASGAESFETRQLESYFFLFSGAAARSEAFQAFWQGYRMSSDKSYTIKHGEVGFSTCLMERGLRLKGMIRRQEFLQAMEEAGVEDLRLALDYAVYADEHHARDGAALLAGYDGSPDWRAQALAHVKAVALRRPFNVGFPLAADRLFGTAYVKKNSQAFFHRMRMQILRGIDSGLIAPPPPDLLSEFRAMVEDYERNPPANAERTL
ncbi:rhamnan synthesis F family protein [Falsigemmobacter faecalis]|uniref:Rhamnan synthesis protein F family n=1 Tax=Falsigemmobacter faecalis TaxID=2488730 RepID=A0A3P3DAY4_9RHOB|nr:rhamnan synthesis F family protein [Falsigemmobacter faecalis]RRH71509.1 rhamnan synthesis protein F family [Falsigemmobacter faecalis]